MGRIRSGMGDGHHGKNEEHLQELCRLLADPNASIKALNTLYAIRTAWATRGYLVDRELLIVRTDSQGEYQSRAAKRAAVARNSTLSPETPEHEDKVTIGQEISVSPESNVNTERAQIEAIGRKKK